MHKSMCWILVPQMLDMFKKKKQLTMSKRQQQNTRKNLRQKIPSFFPPHVMILFFETFNGLRGAP